MNKKVFIICVVLLLAVLIILPISINLEKKNVSTNISELQDKEEPKENEENNKYEKTIDEIKKSEEVSDSMQKSAMFHKMNNYIVYANNYDKGIYLCDLSQNTGSKIATIEEGIDKMYFDGQYIYVMPSYYRGKGIYKISLSGEVAKIYDKACLQLWIEGEKIYFVIQEGYDEINHNPQGTIAVMDKNGQNIVPIITNIKNNFFIQGDFIYYTSQSRQLYKSTKDGMQKEVLTVGRKYVTTLNGEFLTYIDYGDGESKHLLNLNTKAETNPGRFGGERIFLDNLYMYTRTEKYGVLDNDFSLYQLENNKLENKGTYKSLGTDTLKYIYNNKMYLSNQDKGTYTIDINTNKEENDDKIKDCNYFIGGNAYSIKEIEGVIQPIKTVNLDTLEESITNIE